MIKQTLRDWLQELPEPYQSKAMANVERQDPVILDSKSYMLEAAADLMEYDIPLNLGTVLQGAFSWATSTEGPEYWKSVRLRIDVGLPLI